MQTLPFEGHNVAY